MSWVVNAVRDLCPPFAFSRQCRDWPSATSGFLPGSLNGIVLITTPAREVNNHVDATGFAHLILAFAPLFSKRVFQQGFRMRTRMNRWGDGSKLVVVKHGESIRQWFAATG